MCGYLLFKVVTSHIGLNCGEIKMPNPSKRKSLEGKATTTLEIEVKSNNKRFLNHLHWHRHWHVEYLSIFLQHSLSFMLLNVHFLFDVVEESQEIISAVSK
jgi:hypothetical protein